MDKANHLGMVTTVSEIRQVFGLSKSAVTYAIEENKVRNRKSGNTWILFMPDALKRWGHRLSEEEIIEIQISMADYREEVY